MVAWDSHGSASSYPLWMIDETAIWLRFEALRPSRDERGRRLFAAVARRFPEFLPTASRLLPRRKQSPEKRKP
jgi:hypothetical protein